MNLRHFMIYIAICEEGSITKAAKRLYIAQPSVSLVLSEIEAYYNTILFERINRRLKITEKGKQLLEDAYRLRDHLEEIEEKMNQEVVEKVIRIGSSISISTTSLCSYIQSYNQQYPTSKVKVKVANTEEIILDLLAFRCDFGFVEGVVESDLLDVIPFQKDELVIVGNKSIAPSATLTIKDLQEIPLLVRDEGSGGRKLIEAIFYTHDIPFDPMWESTSSQALLEAAKAGLGITILPKVYVEQHLSKDFIIYESELQFIRSFSMVLHKRKYHSLSIQYFLKEIQKD